MQRSCEVCGRSFEARRSTAKYCGQRCRKRSQRLGQVLKLPTSEPGSVSAVEETRRLLEFADLLNTPLGANLLRLAERLDDRSDTGSALATLSKQHLALVEQVQRGLKTEANPLDEIRARRDRRRRGA